MEKERELEKIDEELETIESAYGKIKFNKVLFGVFAGIGVVCTGAGIVGTVAWGLSVASGIATGLGAATAVTNSIFYKQENDKKQDCMAQEDKLQQEKEKVLARK